MNFGNALDAPPGEGLELSERYFEAVRQAGFDTVRLPARWAGHAARTAPYPIDPVFFARVDRAVGLALAHELAVVLDLHHFHEMQDDPAGNTDLFLALWRQIATRYADRPSRLWFELLNEPRPPMTDEQWNALVEPALAVVRESNPTRTVVVGPTAMNDLAVLPALRLPDDPHLAVTIHYYAPFAFTHQGAHWVAGADRWLGTSWGSAADLAAVEADLRRAADWAGDAGQRLFIGEFGAYERADPAARARWTRAVRQTAERLGIGWIYWEFGTDFGAYDPAADAWREPLKEALLGPDRGTATPS
ncbi:glycoside hydrolase family 5 protein [Plantactinospora sp. B6F1]|uniref:glycoside hydrolase family 5 protein n=1 Tax=Plantactinospora sp. B6F1 TaxID=3158971 RepID=UPI0032D921F0